MKQIKGGVAAGRPFFGSVDTCTQNGTYFNPVTATNYPTYLVCHHTYQFGINFSPNNDCYVAYACPTATV